MAVRAASAAPGSEETLTKEIERLLGHPLDERSWTRLGGALTELHDRFVSETPPEQTHTAYFTARESLAAYLAYFFLASAGQVKRALAEVALPSSPTLKVLDIGSGPGPASIAIAELAASNGQRADVTALEAAPLALQSLSKLWRPSYGSLETKEWRAGQSLPSGPFDVIVASHVLNELYLDVPDRLDRRTALALELARKLKPGGLLLLMEPALKRTARELLVIRDRLLPQGLFALAPCLYQSACPAIQRPRDWCHADRPWPEPALVAKAGQVAGLKRDSLKYAYVILSNAHPDRESTKDSSLFRIVSEPLPEKGKKKFFGCGPSGRHALVRLDKDANDANAPFDRLQRGDIVRLQNLTQSGDGKRIGTESSVTVEVSATDRDLKPS
jgi:ribosomal protein RSM22 (predicted rRNA methylase)